KAPTVRSHRGDDPAWFVLEQLRRAPLERHHVCAQRFSDGLARSKGNPAVVDERRAAWFELEAKAAGIELPRFADSKRVEVERRPIRNCYRKRPTVARGDSQAETTSERDRIGSVGVPDEQRVQPVSGRFGGPFRDQYPRAVVGHARGGRCAKPAQVA